MTDRDPDVGPWEAQEHKAWQARRMEVYAAQIDRMDQGIGRILAALKETDQWENTLIVFLADNGGCAEELSAASRDWIAGSRERVGTTHMPDGREISYGNSPDIVPGTEDTYSSYGLPWANVSNTPFRLYKHWVHEGGIATPFIAHWPAGLEARGDLRHQPAQLPDIMATFLDIAGVDYPATRNGTEVQPLEGFSMTPTFADQPHNREVLVWEHEGNRAVRKGKWKLVNRHPDDWELYDLELDRTEMNNVATDHPETVRELTAFYHAWAKRCHVMLWEELTDLRRG